MQNTAKDAFSGIQTSISTCMGVLGQVMGLLAGGALFKGAIDATTKWDSEIAKLSRTLGISMGAASDLNVALRLVGTDADTYTSALNKLERQLRTNESGLKDLGMATRDANGNLVDGETAMKNALAVMVQYKQGLDQGIVSQILFGRGAEQVAPLLRLTDEAMARATKTAKELGLEVGDKQVTAMKAYQLEVANTKLAFDSLERKIGTYLMPTLKKVATWMNTDGLSALKAFAEGYRQVDGAINGTINSTLRYIGLMPSLQGPLPGGGRWGTLPPPPPKKDDNGLDETAGKGGDKRVPPPSPPPGGGKGGGASSILAEWEQELQRIKDSQTDLNAWSEQKDFEFWAEKLTECKRGSDEWWNIMHRMADDLRTLTAEQKRELDKQAKQQEATNKNIAAMVKVDSESEMKMTKEKYNTLYALGQINASQRAKLERDEDTKSYTDALTAYYKELAALQEHGQELIAKQSSIYLKMEELKRQYLQQMQKAEDQALIAMKTQWDRYATEAGNAITGLLFHHQTMLQTMQSLTEKAFNFIIDAVLKKMVNAWIAGEAAKTTATTSGAAARATAEAAGSATSILTQAGAVLKSIMASAAETFAGIFGFLSPVMGPAAAGPAAAGEGVVMSIASMVPTAEGGWDVPANSFAMLHKREMVLPVNLADNVRNMTAGGEQATIFGGIDGINATFTWGVFFPVIQLFKNGILQQSTVDYGAGPTALTFFPGSIPQPGDTLTILGFGTI